MEREAIREQVRAAVLEHLGTHAGRSEAPRTQPAPADLVTWRRFDDRPPTGDRQLVTEADVMRARSGAKTLAVSTDAIVTPLARETAGRLGVAIETRSAPSQAASPADRPSAPPEKSVVIAADHGGYRLKESLKPFVEGLGFRLIDVGTTSDGPVDYPDFAHRAAAMVAAGRAAFGIVIDAVGIGSAMCANRHRGIRAASCSTTLQAQSAREHNDANVLTLGGRHLGDDVAKAVTRAFLETPFAGGRHLPRVRKIDAAGGDA